MLSGWPEPGDEGAGGRDDDEGEYRRRPFRLVGRLLLFPLGVRRQLFGVGGGAPDSRSAASSASREFSSDGELRVGQPVALDEDVMAGSAAIRPVAGE